MEFVPEKEHVLLTAEERREMKISAADMPVSTMMYRELLGFIDRSEINLAEAMADPYIEEDELIKIGVSVARQRRFMHEYGEALFTVLGNDIDAPVK